MTWLETLFIFVAAFLAVFWEAAFPGLRRLLGVQIDVMPALMVYAALRSSLPVVALLALAAGLWFDSLSVNPLGVSVVPLFVVGLGVYSKRDLILREQVYAQLALGLLAGAAAPLLTLLLLLTKGQTPLLGWGTFWQFFVLSAGCGVVTPVLFELFRWLRGALIHIPAAQSSFRPDREIRRGR